MSFPWKIQPALVSLERAFPVANLLSVAMFVMKSGKSHQCPKVVAPHIQVCVLAYPAGVCRSGHLADALAEFAQHQVAVGNLCDQRDAGSPPGHIGGQIVFECGIL